MACVAPTGAEERELTRRDRASIDAAKLLRAWTKKRRVSERDLADGIDVSKRVADDMLTTELQPANDSDSGPIPIVPQKHFAVRDVLLLNDRDALDFVHELQLLILSRRSHG